MWAQALVCTRLVLKDHTVSFAAAPATTGWRTARRQNMHTLRCRSHSSSHSAWTGGLLALWGAMGYVIPVGICAFAIDAELHKHFITVSDRAIGLVWADGIQSGMVCGLAQHVPRTKRCRTTKPLSTGLKKIPPEE